MVEDWRFCVPVEPVAMAGRSDVRDQSFLMSGAGMHALSS
jgi:hypothetical protein